MPKKKDKTVGFIGTGPLYDIVAIAAIATVSIIVYTKYKDEIRKKLKTYKMLSPFVSLEELKEVSPKELQEKNKQVKNEIKQLRT